MRSALCTTVALVFFSLPSGQLLAQTSPEDSWTAEASPKSEQVSQSVQWGTAPASTAAMLWQPIVEHRVRVLEEPLLNPTPVRAWSDWSTERKWLVVGGGVLALVILGVVSIG